MPMLLSCLTWDRNHLDAHFMGYPFKPVPLYGGAA